MAPGVPVARLGSPSLLVAFVIPTGVVPVIVGSVDSRLPSRSLGWTVGIPLLKPSGIRCVHVPLDTLTGSGLVSSKLDLELMHIEALLAYLLQLLSELRLEGRGNGLL